MCFGVVGKIINYVNTLGFWMWICVQSITPWTKRKFKKSLKSTVTKDKSSLYGIEFGF
jgi:hypothetical protein